MLIYFKRSTAITAFIKHCLMCQLDVACSVNTADSCNVNVTANVTVGVDSSLKLKLESNSN